MRRILRFVLPLCFLSLLSCGEKEPVAEATRLSLSKKEVSLPETASTTSLTLKANKECTITSSETWCSGALKGSTLTVSATENPDKGLRTATLTVTCAEKSEQITVKQLGWGKAIRVSDSAVTIPTAGGDYELLVTANLEYSITADGGWISVLPDTKAHEMVEHRHLLRFQPNLAEQDRTTTIVFRDKGGDTSLDARVAVTQQGLKEYASTKLDDKMEDIRIPVVSGEASSWQDGEGIEKSFDGDFSTLYHSAWSNTGPNYFPITLTFNFSGENHIDYLVYHPRTSGNDNGNFKETDILYKLKGGDWVTYSTEDFKGIRKASRVDFTPPLDNVESIRFIVRSGAGDSGPGFASCSEMEFFRINQNKFDPLTLFVDKACSALKPGVTDADIAACPSLFFRNIALFMKNGKYPSEFRIQDYKPYPDPNALARVNKTNPYSFMDSATGIFAPADEEVVVMVDGLGRNAASLLVQNLDKPGGDGFYGWSYNISDGVNKIKLNTKGLLYIVYQPEHPETAPDIKVHIASGQVNGYFDIRKHAPEEWTRRLSEAKADYFDVLGEYAHLTFPTGRFRNHTSDGAALIRAYDDIVRSELELMGMFRYGRTFPNRMHLIVVYQSYMYATNHYTAYNDGTLADLCDLSKLTTGSCWGPAHEIGHSNQTRPGFKWHGTTEVTNNVMSEYIQTVLFRQPSRIQTEDMGEGLPNRYAKAWRDIVAARAPYHGFSGKNDVFCMLVPLWQLQLYFGNVLGRTPDRQADKGGFYPDVYEYVRTHPDLATPGEQQTEFVYTCSKLSGLDLLDFFTKWGFLTPLDIEVDDYGKRQVTITQQRADEIRQRVAALNLPEPDIALEYITDNNQELFKMKPAVVPGTASRSEAKVTMKDWKNVAVYEVRDASDKLVFASEGVLGPSTTASFTVPGGWQSGYKVYALSATRQRTEVKL